MTYAKYVSKTEIQIATQEEYQANPELWSELVESVKPTDVSIFKDYVANYSLMPMGNKIYQTWKPVVLEPVGRVAKLDVNELVFPQTNEYNSQGGVICNYPNLPNSRKLADGWLLIKETEYPNDGKKYRETGHLVEEDGIQKIEIVWIEVIPEPYGISKINLKRALQGLDKWDDFLGILSQNPDAKEDFDLAVTLMSNDPLVISMTQICTQAFGMSMEQVQALLAGCKSDIQ